MYNFDKLVGICVVKLSLRVIVEADRTLAESSMP